MNRRLEISILFSCLLLLFFVLCATLAQAQTTRPPDRIQGGGGTAIFNPAGGLDITSPLNQSMLLNRALGWRCLIVQPPVAPLGQARVYSDCTTQLLRISTNGGAYVTLGGTGAAGTGTLTSISLSNLAPLFTVSPSAITTSGTFTFALNSQAASSFFAAPAGVAGAPVFRGIVASDIPAFDVSKLASGVLAPPRGGTGLAPPFALGDLLFTPTTTTWGRLPGNTTTNRKFLFSEGNGTNTTGIDYAAIRSVDVPAIDLTTLNAPGGVTNVLPTNAGGTGRSTVGGANTLFGVNAAGNGYEAKSAIAGNNISITHSAGGIRFDVNSVVATSTLAPDGSAAAPSISFQNEQTSGFYRNSAGDLRFAVGSTDVARFFSGGLGLGTNGVKFGTLIGSPDVTLTRASAGGLRIDGTAAGNGTLTLATLFGNVTGTASGNELPLSFAAPLARTGNAVSIPQASSTVNGFLSGADFSTFNSKQSALGFSTAASTNTASTIVARDASGNFSAGTITAALSGHANSDLALSGGTLSGNLSTSGNLTAGTTTSGANALTAAGGASIGAGYTATAAPTNGLIVQGSVLIARTTPAAFATLQVGDGTTDTRSLFTPSNSYAIRVANGTAAGGYYIGATSGVNADLIFSNYNGTERLRLTDSGQLISSIPTGTPPFSVTSTTVVPNLNAALLNGQTATNANTVSTLVARDASGNFGAGTITAANLTSANVGSHINQAAANSDLAGQLTIAAGSNQNNHAFATAYNSSPVCTASLTSPTSSPQSYFVVTTITAVTVALNSSATAPVGLTFNYICIGNPN